MSWNVVDIALRSAAGALFVTLALIMLRDARRQLVGRAGVALSVAAVCYLSVSAPSGVDLSAPWLLPLLIGSISMPVTFWIFAGAWFDDEFELGYHHLIAWIVLLASGLAHVLWLRHLGGGFATAGGVLLNILSVLFVGLGLAAAWRGRDADLVESRRRLRTRLVAAVGLYMTIVIATQLLLGNSQAPQSLSALNALGTFMLALAVAIIILGPRDSALLDAPRAAPGVESIDPALLARLESHMTVERAYRQEGLTIGALATTLGLPEHRLRRVINGRLGHRNFNAYLNGYRLAEAKAALGDPAQREVPVTTIALDAGFGSLAAFNRAFRADTGMTPSAFRQKWLGG